MSNLPTSGNQITFNDIVNNRTGGDASAGDAISIQGQSIAFASGSEVDGDTTQTTARKNLEAAPFAISEFHNADFISDIFSNIVITTAGGGSDRNTVDTETLQVSFDSTVTPSGGDEFIITLVDGGGNVDATTTKASAGTAEFTNLAITPDNYTPTIQLGFASATGDTITHHDKVVVGAITTPGLQTVANNSVTTDIEHQISITNDNSFNDINWTFAKSSGDGSVGTSTISNSSDRSPTVTYTGAGVFSISCRVDGTPTQARNSADATNNGVTHTIAFSKAITINNPSSTNEGIGIAAIGTHQGFSSGIDVDLIQASDNSVLLSNDDTTNSLVNVTSYNQNFTAPSRTDSTLSVKVKAFDGSDSATSNAFNIYPLISQQFDANDLSFGASAVEVNQNVTLDVANDVTDNIVGYQWSNQGSGNMTVQSGNASAGDTDGSADDSVSIIDLTDQSHPTVRFDTVEQNKTIRLSLFGRTNQTATADKTIDVELADALSITAISNTNSPNAITVQGNHSGFENGVTAGFVASSNTTSFVQSTEETTNPDSRFTQRSFSENFTPADQTTTQTLQGRVTADGESDSANTSNFSYFPELRSNRNTINPDITTIFSSTNNTKQDTTSPLSCSFNTPSTATDNVTSRQYSTNGLSGHTFANGSATSHSAATTTFGGGTQVGSTLVKLDIAGNSNQTSLSTQNITVNFSEEVTPTGLQEGSDRGFNQQLGVQYTVQGFTATRIDGELYDTADLDTKIGSTAIFENGVSLGAAQTLSGTQTTNINPQTTFSVGSPATADGEDGFKIKLIGKDSGGTIQATAFTNAFQLFVQASDTINTQTLLGAEIGYPTLLDAADTTPEGTNSTETVHLIGTIADSRTLFTSATLATAFDGDPLNDNTRQHYSNASNVFVVNDSGVVSSLRSRTPNQPTIVSSSFTEDSILIRVSANTEVTRTFTTSITPSGGSPTTANHTVSSQASSHTQDITFSSLDGNKSHAIFVTPKNNDKTGTQSSTVNITTAALVRTLSVDDSATADTTMRFVGTSFSGFSAQTPTTIGWSH